MALKVGIQMYSVRNAMQKDPIWTIGKVSEMGYKYIELANLNAREDPGCGFGAGADELNRAIRPFGAKIVSAHIDPLDKENIDRVLEYHTKLGTECIMSKSIDVTYEGVLRQCEILNYIGTKCKEAGISHCLHTGVISTAPDGRDILEIYTENTDDGALFFEFDTYWALRSGKNPVDMIRKHADRIRMVHQKDIPAVLNKPVNIIGDAPLDGEGFMKYYSENMREEDFAEIGSGTMDIQGIIDAVLSNTNADYMILEQDFTSLDEFESIRRSMEGMKKLHGLEL